MNDSPVRRPSVGSGRVMSLARAARRFASIFCCASATVWLCGCATSREVLTEAQLYEKQAADTAEFGEEFKQAVEQLTDRLAREQDEFAAGKRAAAPVLDLIAISGGGDRGAFGAGFMVGWGSASNPADRRPDFDVVTGVSTGALIAPFVYLGTDEACRVVESFYREPKSDWVLGRGLLPFLPWLVSFTRIPGLERDIRRIVDDKFIEQMAEQSRSGKLLAISATNLDLGAQRYWEVGVEAQRAQASGNRDRITKIMLASSAIPVAFPPVEIDGFMYADGGVTANVLVPLDLKTPTALLPTWKRKFPDRALPKIRYWIIVNKQLRQPPKTVPPKWPAIMGPRLATAVRSATIAELRWLAAQVDFANAALGTDIEVRVTAIPNDWRAPVEGDFKKETMVSLVDLGRQMGADPKSWTLWASPPKSLSR